MSRSAWLLTDAAMDLHAAPGHPERPDRRGAAADGMRDVATELGLELVEPEVSEVTDADLLAIHDPDHVRALTNAEARGGGWLDADTYLASGSLRAARLAAGATVQAALAVAGGQAEVAFAAVRPPGHHAARDRASGFCLFNNVAVAVAALRGAAEAGGASRIAICDWDVHHGDGTQALFDADADVLYASTHQSPLYPGTGSRTERGSGAARGTKRNVPLPPGAGDEEFVAAWREELLPAVEEFAPEAILVSAGFDAHRADPLANLEVTEAGYAAVARLIGELSRRLGLGGVALTLEGGYDLDAVRASCAATVRGLLDGRHATAGRG